MITTPTAEELDLPYQSPDKKILELVDAPLAPGIRMNADATKAILLYRNQFKTIAELSEKEMRLAGLRINPKTNISSRENYYYNIKILDIDSSKEFQVTGLPDNARIANLIWSPDQKKVAFTNTILDGVELWVFSIQDFQAKKLVEAELNANMGDAINWLKDNENILVTKLPKDQTTWIDTNNSIPNGPTISINDGGVKAQNRTYQDLLKNPNDEKNFKRLASSEIWKVHISGRQELWKSKDMYSNIHLSPDGNYVLVQTIYEPFSYLVPYHRFPNKTEIYTIEGDLVNLISEVPLIEELPKGFMAVRKGKRSITWRSDKANTLYWVEALDSGDPAIDVENRDAVFQLSAPFGNSPQLLLKTKYRFHGVEWAKGNFAVCYDYWWNTRLLRTVFFNPSDPEEEPKLFNERNYQDRYSDPGSFVTERNAFGKSVLDLKGNQLFLLGEGYSENGKFPFVDSLDIRNNQTNRIYQADNQSQLEILIAGIDMGANKVLTRLESKNTYPNYYFRNVRTGELLQITSFENPFKAIQDVHKEIIHYKREDGLELSATMYLPVGYTPENAKSLPAILWAYPREFKDKNSAAQVTASENEFTYPWYGSPLFWLNKGYVILDDAAFPIIGVGEEEPNDTFRTQLVANARAAIDAVYAMGFVDKKRVAVGGHSYGAFMVANLLSHSDLFAAGIARSGAYNRTLTPFGFQSEERSYWEAPDVYNAMSPFMQADKMKTPLLLIHGGADNNAGTYPMQSERYFNALKGLGATVRLCLLPKESHGYIAKESILHMLWEQDQWLERFVKNKNIEN